MSYSLDNYCRLCANINRKLQFIDSELENQINLLFQVEISENDKLPKRICRRCLDTVNNSWIFFNKIHEAQEKLEHCIKYEIKSEECSNASVKDEKASISSKFEETLQKLHEFVVEKVEFTEEIVEFVKEEEMPLLENCLKAEDVEPLNPSESWPDYPWICSICGEKCGDIRGYSKHHCFEFHKRYFCVDCPKAYARSGPFLAHVSDQHWNRLQAHLLLQCDVCQIWFHSRDKQENHRQDEHPFAEPRTDVPKKESDSNDFICIHCCKSFTSRSNLNFHQKVHTGLKEFTCDECGKSYSRKSVFLNHERIHVNGKEYTCDQCGRSFNQRCNLEEHMALHTDVRPYACATCARRFKTPRCLRTHEAVHSEDKPHICHVCGREFKARSSLRDHLKSHETDKAFECEYCGKAFGLKKVLQVHRRLHTGAQPYTCAICDQRFAVWAHWTQHLKQVHTDLQEYTAQPETVS